MKKIYLNFPVTFTPNLAGTLGPNYFFPCYIGLPTATEASFKAGAKPSHSHYFSWCFSLRWFCFKPWTQTSRLQCFHFSASVCVSRKWMQINCIFLPLWMWPSWMAVTPAGYGEVRDSDGLICPFSPQQEEIPSQTILAFFSLSVAILVLDLIRFLQVWLVDDMSNPLPSFLVHLGLLIFHEWAVYHTEQTLPKSTSCGCISGKVVLSTRNPGTKAVPRLQSWSVVIEQPVFVSSLSPTLNHIVMLVFFLIAILMVWPAT